MKNVLNLVVLVLLLLSLLFSFWNRCFYVLIELMMILLIELIVELKVLIMFIVLCMVLLSLEILLVRLFRKCLMFVLMLWFLLIVENSSSTELCMCVSSWENVLVIWLVLVISVASCWILGSRWKKDLVVNLVFVDNLWIDMFEWFMVLC